MVSMAIAPCMSVARLRRVRNLFVIYVLCLYAGDMHSMSMVFIIVVSIYPHYRSIIALAPGFSREVKEGSVTVLRGHKSGHGVCL